MKKGLVFSFVFLFILIMFVSFISAAFFSNFFGKITGKSVEIDLTPRVSFWAGKVNQHVENGVWMTDPDGVSGAEWGDTEDKRVEYCKKFYGDKVVSTKEYRIETIDTWCTGGNVVCTYSSSRTSYECVFSEVAPSCSDGIQNGDETGIDCGGSCSACSTAQSCSETDTGIDIDKAGTVTDSLGEKFSDACFNNTAINETSCIDPYYIQPDGEFNHIQLGSDAFLVQINCPSGEVCQEGACVESTAHTFCEDSDANAAYPYGKNYYVKGYITWLDLTGVKKSAIDSCGLAVNNVYDSNTLTEFVCDGDKWNKVTYECPNACEDGACVGETTLKCNETDKGIDYYHKGITHYFYDVLGDQFYGWHDQQDQCSSTDPNVLWESSCDYYASNELNPSKSYTCPNGCEDGACIGEPESSLKAKTLKPSKVTSSDECTTGCFLDGKCYAIGYRKGLDYCSQNKVFVKQKAGDFNCLDNSECLSNVCMEGKCIQEGVWKRFMFWLNKLFRRSSSSSEDLTCTECLKTSGNYWCLTDKGGDYCSNGASPPCFVGTKDWDVPVQDCSTKISCPTDCEEGGCSYVSSTLITDGGNSVGAYGGGEVACCPSENYCVYNGECYAPGDTIIHTKQNEINIYGKDPFKCIKSEEGFAWKRA